MLEHQKLIFGQQQQQGPSEADTRLYTLPCHTPLSFVRLLVRGSIHG